MNLADYPQLQAEVMKLGSWRLCHSPQEEDQIFRQIKDACTRIELGEGDIVTVVMDLPGPRVYPALANIIVQVLKRSKGGILATFHLETLPTAEAKRLLSGVADTPPSPEKPKPVSDTLLKALEAINANLLVHSWALVETGILSKDKYEEKLKWFYQLIGEERAIDPQGVSTLFEEVRKKLGDKGDNKGDKSKTG